MSCMLADTWRLLHQYFKCSLKCNVLYEDPDVGHWLKRVGLTIKLEFNSSNGKALHVQKAYKKI